MARLKNTLNPKYIPTKKLKEILDENYCRGVSGTDYEPIKQELESVLWERQSRNDELEVERKLRELEEYEECKDR